MTESFVKAYEHLKDRPKADKALAQLQRISSLVKPIMRKHGWILPVLAEFFPDNPSLLGLNVNAGQKILVRLRPAWSPDTFYDEEDLVHTMLHELTHNVHGPHDDKFYKFLSELEAEYEALKRSGYAGEGFHSKGHRLGQHVSHDLPPHLARLKAVEAAEKRRRVGGLMASGGRLGGAPGQRRLGMSPRELAAEAAERRALDEKACGQGALAESEAAKAARASAQTRAEIDLTLDEDEGDTVIVGPLPPVSGSSEAAIRSSGDASSSMTVVAAGQSSHAEASQDNNWACSACTVLNAADMVQCTVCLSPRLSTTDWTCGTCTLLNSKSVRECNACGTRRPLPLQAATPEKAPHSTSKPSLRHPYARRSVKPSVQTSTVPQEWDCLTCGETGMPHEFWSCRFCGTVKLTSERLGSSG